MDGSHARFFPTGSWAEAVAVHSSLLAVGVCGTPSCSVMLFDYMTGTLLSKVTHPELSSRCSSLSLSWDGSVVFAVSTGAVLLFNTEDGTHVRTLNVQDELGDVVDALPTGRDELVLLTRNEGLYVMSLNDSTFGLLTHVRDSPARQKVKKQRKAVSWSGGLARQRGKLFVLDRNRVRCWY